MRQSEWGGCHGPMPVGRALNRGGLQPATRAQGPCSRQTTRRATGARAWVDVAQGAACTHRFASQRSNSRRNEASAAFDLFFPDSREAVRRCSFTADRLAAASLWETALPFGQRRCITWTSRTNFIAPPLPLLHKRRVNSKQIKHLQHDSGPPHYKRARLGGCVALAVTRNGATCQC